MDMQNVAKLNIPEGEVRTIHDKDGNLIWGKVSYGVKYKGDTSQQTYTGKNLLKMPIVSGSSNGITWTVQDDGSIILNGTSTAGVSIRANNVTMPAVGGETYTLSATGMGEAYNFGYKNSGSGENIFVVTSASPTTTAVVTSTMLSQANRLDMYIRSGKTFNNQRVTLQLEKNSQATDFEPYVGGVPAPNPDYPQAVQTVTGENTLTISDGTNTQSYEVNLGKNMLTFGGSDISDTKFGITYSYNATTQEWTFSGTATSQIEINYPSGAGIDMHLDSGVRYTTTGFYQSGTIANGSVRLFQQDSVHGWQGITVAMVSAADASESYTPNANLVLNDAHIIRIANGTTLSSFKVKFQTEKGSTATSYAPYFTPIELCKIGTYQDYIYKSGGKWYVRKEVGKAVLDGSEAWETPNNRSYSLYKANSKISNMSLPLGTLQMLCDYFTPTQSYDAVGSVGTGNSFINFNYDGTSSNLAGFKTWLANNNVSLYAPLTTPTDTEITSEALIGQLEAVEQWSTRYGYNATVSGNLPIIIDRTAL